MNVAQRILIMPLQAIVFILLVLTAPIWIALLVRFVKHLDS